VLDRLIDRVLMDVKGVYHNERHRFSNIEKSLLPKFLTYNPDPLENRLSHLQGGYNQYLKVYGKAPKSKDQFERLVKLKENLSNKYKIAYRKVTANIGIEHFLNDVQWSRSLGMTLISIYRVDKSTPTSVCEGLYYSQLFRSERPHLNSEVLDSAIQQLYTHFIDRNFKDLKDNFANFIGLSEPGSLLNLILSLEKELIETSTALVTDRNQKLTTFNRKSYYFESVTLFLQWFSDNVCLSEEELYRKRISGVFSLFDVQVHISYQLAEKKLLEEIFRARENNFINGFENFENFAQDIRLPLMEVVFYRNQLRKISEKLNQKIEIYLPEQYLAYLISAENQYRQSVFHHFRRPVLAEDIFPPGIYSQIRPDVLIAQIPKLMEQMAIESQFRQQLSSHEIDSFLNDFDA